MSLTNQKRLAAQVLKCGVHRVWVDDKQIDRVETAVGREDIRMLIEEGIISAKQKRGTSRGRTRHHLAQKAKGRRRGHGSRKGSSTTRTPKKRRWMMNIRAQRRTLKGWRDDGILNRSAYRRYYLRAKGGNYRSVAHMRAQVALDGIAVGDD